MGARWWLLAEDPRHERLALFVARALGLNDQPVKSWRAPSGQGSAAAWVLKQYAQRVRETTRKRPGERVALLVMIDGDNLGCSRRKQQFDESLGERREPLRAEQEPIVLLIPTWSVETWLLGVSDESVSFKERLRPGEESPAMFQAIAARLRERRLEDVAASLRDARTELDRLPR